MIPLKLTLQNFLSYRDANPALDLSGIRVACLCGNNGHGKSALLDSVTWALWGKARGSGHNDLLHHGRSHMSVELEFHAADTRYRVTRRFSRLRGSSLELQIHAHGAFYPLTGNSIRHTQAKIDQITGMDYDTFINSAFLIQGRAGEFTNKTPAERKEVLGKIIGLDRFNELQQRSRDKTRHKARQGDELEGKLQYMRNETAAKKGLKTDLETTQNALQTLSDDLETKNLRAHQLRLEIQNLQRRASEAEEIRRRIPQLKSEIYHYESEARQRSARIQTCQDLIARQSSIENGYAQYQHSLQENHRLNAARARYDQLANEINALQQSVAQAKARLEEQRRSHQRRLKSELEPAARKSPDIQRRLSETTNALGAISDDEKTLDHDRQTLQALTLQTHTLAETQTRIADEGRQLSDKLKLLQASHQNARCPLCDATLGEEGCLRLADTYDAELNRKRNEFRQNRQTLTDLQSREKRLTRQLHDTQNTLQRRKQQTQRQSALLERELQDSRRAHQEADDVRKALQNLTHAIQNNQFAPDQQVRLESTQAALQSLQYSPQTHADLSQKLQNLQKFQLLNQQLSEATQQLPHERKSLAQARQQAHDRRAQLNEIRQTLADLENEPARLAETQSQLTRLAADIKNLQSRQNDLLAQQGKLHGSLQRIEELERQITHQTRELRRIRDEQAIYEELRVAFGREGVQALLIDTILPQIELEANDLLARMTEGRMSVKLETQRPLQSRRGQFAETLEIKVSDELGHRTYEMFSGGEAFRINLSLRIALSKVLANRSGAPLPTLFIDEGFGTQDAAGREQILDVLSTLEQDFKCIIVITHLEDMKDNFPVRIEVQKQNGASTAHLT